MSEYVCFNCNGRGWVPDGHPEDGRMTGREHCYTCDGTGRVDGATLLAFIKKIIR